MSARVVKPKKIKKPVSPLKENEIVSPPKTSSPKKTPTDEMKKLNIGSPQEIYTEPIIDAYLKRFINLYARKNKQMYEFTWSENAPATDLIVEWKIIVAYIQEYVKPPKKLFKVSIWKARMKEIGKAPCISKIVWK